MRLNPAIIALLAAGGMMLQASPGAHAAIISGAYTITGSEFVSSQTPPDSAITEVVSISFDNSANISDQSTGISLMSGTITPSSTLVFSYLQATDTLEIGGIADTVTDADPNSTDFAATIGGVSTTPDLASLSYSTATGASYTATTFGASFARGVATPEPASLLLVASGLAGLLLMRRQRRAG